MEYTVNNFKREGLANKITPIEFMVAEKDGLVETDKGSMNVLKGDYICKGSDRVWVVDEKYFNDNYKLAMELSDDELLILLFTITSLSLDKTIYFEDFPKSYELLFDLSNVLKSLKNKKFIKKCIDDKDRIYFEPTKDGVKFIKEHTEYAKVIKNLLNDNYKQIME